MWTRMDLKMRAKQAFRNNYWACVGVAFLATIIASAFSAGSTSNGRRYVNGYGGYPGDGFDGFNYGYSSGFDYSGIAMLFGSIAVAFYIFMMLLMIFVGSALEVGGNRFFVLNQTERPTVGTIFHVFKSGHYGNVVLTIFLRDLFIGLWALLLVVPGIIKSYEYLMVSYILAENPGMNRKEAFLISKRMMNGQKMDAFVLSISFFGWYLLSFITCGVVGLFYVTPYVQATFAELYAVNRVKAFNEGYIR